MRTSDRSRSSARWGGLVALLSVVRACKQGTPIVSPKTREASAQLHVAEYQALSTRITHLIVLQYSVLGAVAAILLDFMKQPAGPLETGMHIWTVVIAVEIFIGAYYYTLFEIMSSRE